MKYIVPLPFDRTCELNWQQPYIARTKLPHRKEKSFRLDPNISQDALDILLKNGLSERCPVHASELHHRRTEAHKIERATISEQQAQIKQTLQHDEPQLISAIRAYLADCILKTFPSVLHSSLSVRCLSTVRHISAHSIRTNSLTVTTTQNHWARCRLLSLYIPGSDASTEHLTHLCTMYPDASPILAQANGDARLKTVGKKFQIFKQNILQADLALEDQGQADDEARQMLVQKILQGKDSHTDTISRNDKPTSSGWMIGRPKNVFSFLSSGSRDRYDDPQDGTHGTRKMDDAQFLAALPTIIDRQPLLTSAAEEVLRLAHDILRRSIEQLQTSVVHKIQSVQEIELVKQFTREAALRRERDLLAIHVEFLNNVKNLFTLETDKYISNI
jgi:hypothetical protein